MSCSGTLPVTGSWAGSIAPDLEGYNNVVYVAIADNVDTDGSLALPYHTIAEGLAEAAARSPSATTPVLVYVFGGNFSESGLTVASHVHLQGSNRDTTIIRHASQILTAANDNTSVSGITFEATGTNRILAISGTSLTDYVRFYDCKFVGNGDDGNAVYFQNGALAEVFDCTFESNNVGERILETDTNASNDVKVYNGSILGDVLHTGGDLEFFDETANMGVSCTGSSNLSISDTFWRNSVDHCLELGTTGNVFLYRNTLVSPGFVTPDNFYCVNATVDPGSNVWIDNNMRHDGADPDYTIFSSVSFTFSGDRNDLQEGYNSNCTDDGLETKATPVGADLIVMEDSEDNWKRKKFSLSNIPFPDHATNHISAGSDEIDGDQLDIDWDPTNYTPGTAPTEVTSLDHLTAHLYGIDQSLAGPFTPSNHASTHEDGGGDEINVDGLSGLLADEQNPVDHADDHIDGGVDPIDGDKLEISWTGYTTYTPTTSPTEVDSTDDLTAHLAGIDAAIAAAGANHASTHLSGAADEINGDQLDIDWNPTNYTPATTPTEVTDVDHLTAHLYGIDQVLGTLSSPTRKYGATFNETPNGVLTTFTISEDYIHALVGREAVFYNGQRLKEGSGNDYVATESGGVGTGYDSIVMAVAPHSDAELLIDYTPDT